MAGAWPQTDTEDRFSGAGRQPAQEVPVILVTYNRPWHTQQVLAALRNHGRRQLLIFSDAPRSPQDEPQVQQTRTLIEAIDWCQPVKVFRTKNLGLAQSILQAVEQVFAEHDRLILLEDDCVPQEHFFTFVERYLDTYENSPQIFGVSGYSVHLPDPVLARYPNDLYAFPRIGSWGWATWKRAWQRHEQDLEALLREIEAAGIDLAQGGSDVPLMVQNYRSGRLKDVWTLSWLLSVYRHRGLFLYPTRSHVINIGMDGSGVHCGKTSRFETSLAQAAPWRFPQHIAPDPAISNCFRAYYNVPVPPVSVPVRPASDRSVSVLHLSTSDSGGAGNAAMRLHQCLLRQGLDSKAAVLIKNLRHGSILRAETNTTGTGAAFTEHPGVSADWQAAGRRWTALLATYPRKHPHIEMFSDLTAPLRLAGTAPLRSAEVVNLHWVAGMLDAGDMVQALADKPVIWTLHDMNPFTGGCHYAADCDRYQMQCGACPLLGSTDENDITRQIWSAKRKAYARLAITIVTPSQWLAQCAQRSGLFGDKRIEVIPYSLPLDTFRPFAPSQARQSLGLAANAHVILFGAFNLGVERKGFVYLLQALERLHAQGGSQEIVLLSFGTLPKELNIHAPFKIMTTGHVRNQTTLARIYSAADLFVAPSLEDNLPNTVLEAMACGVPVVAFNTGGMPDMIRHGETGFLAQPRSVDGLCEGIAWVLSERKRGFPFASICRTHIEAHYAEALQAGRYLKLYEEARAIHQPRAALRVIQAQPIHRQDDTHWVTEGENHYRQGRLESARLAFEAALAIDPDNYRAKNDLGVVLASLGKADEALLCIRQACRSNPADLDAVYNLRRLLASQSQQAVESLQQQSGALL